VVEQQRTSSHDNHSVATAALLIGAVALLAFVPACSSSSTPATGATSSTTTSTTSSVTLPEQDPAELATCVSDAQTLDEALDAYMAAHGAYPSPPAAWSAATYTANFQPLTASSDGGPYLPSPPATRFYVIEYDSAGHVWIAPPGAYGPYNKGQDFALQPDICDAAVG
jgi:hypothetical protein